MAVNPFKTLGLSPDALRGLNNKQIAELVKHLARGLKTVHHPDHGGDAKRMSDINTALTILSDPALLSEHRKAFLKPRPFKKQLHDLEGQLARVQTERASQTDTLWQYLECLYQNDGSVDSFFDATDIPVRDLAYILAVPNDAFSHKHGEVRAGTYYRLSVRDGKPIKRYLRRPDAKQALENYQTLKPRNEFILGSLSEHIVKTQFDGMGQLIKLLQGKIGLHNVDQSAKAKAALAERYENANLSTMAKVSRLHSANGDNREFVNAFSTQHFKQVLPYLAPTLSLGDLIFSLHIEQDEAYVSITGSVSHPIKP